MKTQQEKHEQIRMKLWCDVWCKVVSDSSSVGTPTTHADAALKYFDMRFNKPIYTVEE